MSTGVRSSSGQVPRCVARFRSCTSTASRSPGAICCRQPGHLRIVRRRSSRTSRGTARAPPGATLWGSRRWPGCSSRFSTRWLSNGWSSSSTLRESGWIRPGQDHQQHRSERSGLTSRTTSAPYGAPAGSNYVLWSAGSADPDWPCSQLASCRRERTPTFE